MEQATIETANEVYATKIVKLLLGFYPQKPSDPETYVPGLVMRCVGVDTWILREMVNPKNSLLRECKFLPTVADLSKFIEKKGKLPPYKPHVREIEKTAESQADKDAAVDRWQKVRGSLGAKSETFAEKRTRRKFKQYHDPEALIRALENLEAQKPGSTPARSRSTVDVP